jgi:hypothetical protein
MEADQKSQIYSRGDKADQKSTCAALKRYSLRQATVMAHFKKMPNNMSNYA